MAGIERLRMLLSIRSERILSTELACLMRSLSTALLKDLATLVEYLISLGREDGGSLLELLIRRLEARTDAMVECSA